MKRAAPLLGAMLLASLAVAAEPAIHSFGPGSFAQIAAGAGGKPQVVMVWSLDCSYCEPSFEALAQAQRRGLKVVTIATDPADDPDAALLIRKKLAKSGLHAETWAFGPAPAEQLRHAIDPKWRGEMPRSYWFDGKGQVRAYSGLIDAERVARMLPN
jgi:thiol-disulfide isomerase/thioredoxin